MKRTNDLRIKLIYFSIAVVMIPMIILYFIILGFFTTRSAQENQRYSFHNIQSISQSLDAAFTGLNEISLYVIANTSVRHYLQRDPTYNEYLQMSSAMQSLPFSSKYYNTVTVLSDSRQTLISGSHQELPITQEEKDKADHLMGSSFWSIQKSGASLVRLMRDTNRLSRSLGYIKIQVNQHELGKLLISPEELPETCYLLLTQGGVMLQNGNIPAEVLQCGELQYDRLMQADVNSETLSAGGRTYLYSARPVYDGKVVVVSLTDRALLYRMDSLLLGSIGVAAVMSVFFVVALVQYYTRRVFDPLNHLGQVMTNFDEKNFETRIQISGNNEITVLVDQFNFMCERLKTLHEQVFINELRLREAELAILQSEINPHFLYNTLDTIYWMSEMSRTWKISEMVKALSNLFRITLQKTVHGLVPLSQEKEYMDGYLTIQQVRYQDQVTFEFYVQEGLEQQQVLKLLLQPLVENAIIHGVELLGGGKVVINIYQEENNLIYCDYPR